jgi:hypothetical protein
MPAQKRTKRSSTAKNVAGGTPPQPGRRELTHADVVSGNERRREQIKQIDRTGERQPEQRGDTANIRQNTSNVNRKHMR